MSSWLINLAGRLWRRMPKRARRLGVLLTESRFTVTTGAVVLDDQGHVLLLKHRFRPGGGWGIPGGFIQPREQPEEAVRRELREETGLEIEAVEVALVRALQTYQQIEIIFRCRLPQGSEGQIRPKGHEISRAEWFALNALPQDLSHDQRGLIERVTNDQ